MALGGAALKGLQTFLYALEFCCAAIILGLYSYFLAVLADRDARIFTWVKAVEGLSGAAVLYTLFAVLLTCFLGGKMFFAFLGMVFDLLFTGAFIAIAVLTRGGSHKCRGIVSTPWGTAPANTKQGFGSNGQGNQVTYAVSFGTACRMNKACFAVAIVGAVLFFISAFVQLALGRHHKREKRYGPSPANNYTYGRGTKFWRRKGHTGPRDPEMAGTVSAVGAGQTTGTLAPGANDYRPSYDTAYTGTTAEDGHKPLVGGYHTAPTGTYNKTGYNAPTTAHY
ncbi:uncharacterized protein EI97DRAFT_367368 [Westerdykella ornata]|uniref:MARVEL domain-containing protein n=1 Tax=Westerdykella ornata TaxID=318751 RepID=A0A6A6JZ11_WESOR|nr:uncharacterized protein EI97DRAFT_367368 [Westerdykella ornata]KAF2281445.1 hypothetical protein EI97DRAFT_367368 [Westerdykella ornata]